MYKRILIATDGSDLAEKGLRHGLALAKLAGAAVTIVTVTEPAASLALAASTQWGGISGDLIEDFDKECHEQAHKTVTAAAALARDFVADFELVHVDNTRAADGILEAAVARSCDLIVMASAGRRGFDKFISGSQAGEVIERSAVPVLVVK